MTQRGSLPERMRTIGDLVAKHCRGVCPFPAGSVKARLWAAEREKDTRETARVSRAAASGLGRGRALRGQRGEWAADELATLRQALAEQVELCRLPAILPLRSVQAIYLKAHRIRRAAA